MNAERRRILFTGRVQGVGFRATTVQLSLGLSLAGTVQNLPDGRVELIVEGPPLKIETLLDRLREHFDRSLRTVDQVRLPDTGKLAPGIHILY